MRRRRKNKKNKLRKILLIVLFIFVAINLFLNKKIAEKMNTQKQMSQIYMYKKIKSLT